MELIQELFLPCLWGMIACIGFGLVFNIQGAGILICGLGGALGWFVYLIAHLLRADGPAASLPGDRLSSGSAFAPGAGSRHL